MMNDENESLTRKLKREIDELLLQLSLGKAEAADFIEDQKKNFGKVVDEVSEKVVAAEKAGTDAGADAAASAKRKLDELKLQLALGRMENPGRLRGAEGKDRGSHRRGARRAQAARGENPRGDPRSERKIRRGRRGFQDEDRRPWAESRGREDHRRRGIESAQGPGGGRLEGSLLETRRRGGCRRGGHQESGAGRARNVFRDPGRD